ncbi:MAG: precorrin-6A reductase [Bacillota bacterium]|nr:precorrin-6A reductase [Bacillota bacterium]
MIWIVGGTSESAILGEIFQEKNIPHLITYATKDGLELAKGNAINKDEPVEDFIVHKNIDTIIDVTHPFAVQMTAKVKKAAEKFALTYLRYDREKLVYPESSIQVDSYEEAYKLIENLKGTFFFTTGSNKIPDFEKVKGSNRFIYRILPTVDSIAKARNAGVEIKDLVAMLGPFSEELNLAMLKSYQPDYLVTKDSGQAGGVEEKISAAEKLGIKTIIITRDQVQGQSWEDFLKEVQKTIEEQKSRA